MRRIRMAMVGGGPGSFIGPMHRIAAQSDGGIELVAGAFSRDPGRSADAGREYGLDPGRVYGDYRRMLDSESRREDRPDFVAIVTPNSLHYEIARAALAAGFHVASDKPATATLAEALALRSVVAVSGRLYLVTYTYTGYPTVREARDLCRRGAIGALRKVVVEFTQGWLNERIELTGHKQAAWRMDPTQAGIGGCSSDIGVHAFNLCEYVTGHKVTALCASLSRVLPGRQLDDDCNCLLQFDNGAPGVLHVSQIAAGESSRFELRVYGEHGSVRWSREDPSRLHLCWLDGRGETRPAGAGGQPRVTVSPRGLNGRKPPEGFIEGFASLYRDFADLLRRHAAGETDAWNESLCGIDDGVRGMLFLQRAIDSSVRSAWVQLE
jgi:predicted dehydrogenase